MLENMLNDQASNEAFLSVALEFGLGDGDPSVLCENDEPLPECDENGNFADDEDDDRIDRELGV